MMSSYIRQVSLLVATLWGCVQFAQADNPIVQTIYTADPAPIVFDNRVYLFTGHDENVTAPSVDMRDWRLFSSADMVNWQHHGSPLSLSALSWASRDAWAAQVIQRNGLFYYYVTITNDATGGRSIGVAVSEEITGPYRDAIGKPLVEDGQIDPTVFIDDDGQAYLYWGNPGLSYVRLNEDMISYSGNPIQVELTVESFGDRLGNPYRNTTLEEGPWFYKRNGLYYMVFAANCCSEDLRYSTGPSATGPWTYRGLIMPAQGRANSNHPGIIDFEGKSYLFYHNGALVGGGNNLRSVSVESFTYTSNGSIPQMNMTVEGPEQVVALNPFIRQEAETIAWSQGIQTDAIGDGGIQVSFIENGGFIKVKGVAFDNGATEFRARVSSATAGGDIELRLDDKTGSLIGVCHVPASGGWDVWTTVSCPVVEAVGTHDLYLNFVGNGQGYLFNFDWWQFQ
ncbi:carbohydrate-binding protein [Colletotrichum scovillei]|uniref:Carbohydrate-binding protein n=2 Tax=Colletotrichum scovillei TaxID=1209932 RepID=A0A9P7QRP5_9PEZI|nr:carbohydrate-binding protein [Colletotrichum scovillei]KAG7041584.1 carbohydrate-binding protein [Colletotrichum scovillei]